MQGSRQEGAGGGGAKEPTAAHHMLARRSRSFRSMRPLASKSCVVLCVGCVVRAGGRGARHGGTVEGGVRGSCEPGRQKASSTLRLEMCTHSQLLCTTGSAGGGSLQTLLCTHMRLAALLCAGACRMPAAAPPPGWPDHLGVYQASRLVDHHQRVHGRRHGAGRLLMRCLQWQCSCEAPPRPALPGRKRRALMWADRAITHAHCCNTLYYSEIAAVLGSCKPCFQGDVCACIAMQSGHQKLQKIH